MNRLDLVISNQQHESPEPKRSKPRENFGAGGEAASLEESPEVKNRRMQRELMAAAAEKRMAASRSAVAAAQVKNVGSVKDVEMAEKTKGAAKSAPGIAVENVGSVKVGGLEGDSKGKGVNLEKVESKSGISGTALSVLEADELFLMIFGNRVSKDVLAQWSNQGIRFSDDPETSMGLVQHEGGPCGVLAAIQAFVLKYLLFSLEESDNVAKSMSSNLATRRVPKNEFVAADILSSLSEGKKSRALVKSMSEILFLCGSNQRAIIASMNILNGDFMEPVNGSEDEVIAKMLGGLSLESGSDLHKVLRVDTCTSRSSTLQKLDSMLPVFRSRMGALLFLISALLSRGLDKVQEDRDDPSQPLVTAPFGHASQEIVNLLLSGSAAANVFDGKMDLGGGMFVKGISTTVEVGFLTLLESLNFCKVGQYLKCPKWPIWVVGSESHYTVLFALDTKVQEENELENRESQIRRAFDAEDQSGGGGFISVEGFHKVVKETGINFPPEKVERLCGTGFIVWSEFWQALLDLDKSLGGVKDSTGSMGKKVFDLYHFNGIAKSIANGTSFGNESPIQRPRLTKLRVSVPPRWTPEEFMANVQSASASGTNQSSGVEDSAEVSKPQHAPLVDCIRTRWARAVCNWDGDAPSIV
ncbi:hypothetical protein BUALT_Bualt01G0017300 [Buddleja alternifolia]|uniref:ubiquitinyl hydrolase 1 n=1 Tax=Buddleja alternifolia TaxID=168488 RepID=A0AAV6Y3R1_9LAMI|nr:hypothetical protein BUALT_Bualt01G0017300 [Buddleja alternifolia]